MKRKLVVCLVTVFMIAVVGCGSDKENNSDNKNSATQVEESQTPESELKEEQTSGAYDDATAVLTAMWNQVDDKFAVIGGTMDAPVDGAPGKVDTADTDTMTSALLVPTDVQGAVTDIACLTHMMNANTYTAVAMKVDGIDTATIKDKLKETFLTNQYMCGFPDKMAIAEVDGYIVYAYGSTENIVVFEKCIKGLKNANSDIMIIDLE